MCYSAWNKWPQTVQMVQFVSLRVATRQWHSVCHKNKIITSYHLYYLRYKSLRISGEMRNVFIVKSMRAEEGFRKGLLYQTKQVTLIFHPKFRHMVSVCIKQSQIKVHLTTLCPQGETDSQNVSYLWLQVDLLSHGLTLNPTSNYSSSPYLCSTLQCWVQDLTCWNRSLRM